MSETKTPEWGGVWETNDYHVVAWRADGWYQLNGVRCVGQEQKPIRLLGYTAEYVEMLRNRLAHSEAVQVEYREQLDDLQARNDRQQRGLHRMGEELATAYAVRDQRNATIYDLIAERDEAVARAEGAEVALADAETEHEALANLAEREPWRVLRAAERIQESHNLWSTIPGDLAARLEREHGEKSKRDRLIEKLADILGDFAVADEHSGERNDVQLARLLVSRGVTLAEAVDHD